MGKKMDIFTGGLILLGFTILLIALHLWNTRSDDKSSAAKNTQALAQITSDFRKTDELVSSHNSTIANLSVTVARLQEELQSYKQEDEALRENLERLQTSFIQYREQRADRRPVIKVQMPEPISKTNPTVIRRAKK